MTKSKCQKIILLILILVLVLSNFQAFAETPTQEREELERELEELEKEIAEIDKDVKRTEQEKKTLENQIYLLRSRINKLDLQIYQGNIMIKDLGVQIIDTEGSIEETSFKIKDSRKHLARILQLIYESDQKSLIEILLSEEELSDFFNDLVALESLSVQSGDLLENIENLKVRLEEQKDSLDNEKQDLESLVVLQTVQKRESSVIKKDKDWLLHLTETEYQKYLSDKQETQQKAAQIRARIFELIGIPEAPTFGEAYEIAKYVSGITGVRPALLLAVLTQESNIGKNVGQCYLKNPSTGSGIAISSGKTISRIMKPSRDVTPFLTITKELGRDPYNTPVSCPMSIGYGGAMGPAQFIPSTWNIYKDRLYNITKKPGDPWNIKDAFLAAGLYLSDYGATKQTYNGEWKAAMIYFSGTSLRTKYNGYGFYGDSVMAITKRYESDIAALESN